MRSAHRFHSLSLGAACTASFALALAACAPKPKPSDANSDVEGDEGAEGKDAAVAGTQGSTAGSGPGGQVAVGSAGAPSADLLPHEAGVVLGHVMIPSAPRLLERMKEQASTPQTKNFMDANALRSLAALGLGDKGDLAMHLDIDKPIGCAVVDFKKFERPLSCTFGYEGGVEQLVQDLGEKGKKDADGHAAHYVVEGQELYIDPLGDHLVVSPHSEIFGKTKDYIERNMIARSPNVLGELEIMAFPSDAFQLYEQQIAELLAEQMKNSDRVGHSGNPQWDAAAQHWQAYNKKSTEESFERFGDYAQMSAHLAFRPDGVSFGFALIPKPGSLAATTAKAQKGFVVDPSLAEKAPSGTVALGAWASNPQLLLSDTNKDLVAMMSNMLGELTHHDASDVQAGLESLYTSYAASYDGNGTLAIVHEPGAPIALVTTARKQKGKSTRDEYKAWTAAFDAKSILGPFTEVVGWKFQLDHATVSGVPVDRWVIEPTEAGKKALLEDLSAKERADLDALWGPLVLVIDRAETPELVIYTIAPKAEDAFTKRAIEATKGTGSVAGNPGISALRTRGGGASAVLAVDVAAGIDWIKSLDSLSPELDKIPDGIGKDLSDIQMIADYGAGGGPLWFEYVASQALVDQARERFGQ